MTKSREPGLLLVVRYARGGGGLLRPGLTKYIYIYKKKSHHVIQIITGVLPTGNGTGAQNGSDVALVSPPQSVTLYGSSVLGGAVPAGQPLEIEGAPQPGAVTKNGLVLYGSDGKAVSAAGTGAS